MPRPAETDSDRRSYKALAAFPLVRISRVLLAHWLRAAYVDTDGQGAETSR